MTEPRPTRLRRELPRLSALPPRPAPTSLGVRPPAAAWQSNATLAGREDVTASIARLWVRPDAGVPSFEPGQYFALGLQVGGRLVQRPYSTASPPGTRDLLEFLVRLVPHGTLTPHLWDLRPGDRLGTGRPKGLFVLRPNDPRTHLFIATGTGLAPFVAMAGVLDDGDHPAGRPDDQIDRAPRAVVVHGVAHVAELAYRGHFEARSAAHSRFHYLPAISRPGDPSNAGWTGVAGRIGDLLGPVLERLGVDPLGSVAYLCGNPGMIADARRVLAGWGVPEAAIISEHYWTDAGPSHDPFRIGA